MPEPLLEVDNLSVTFPSEGGLVKAVRGVSYTVQPGESLGIVGESGSGKSVSSMAVMGLLPRTARVSGDIRFQGESLLAKNDKQLSAIRGREIAMVFQDPLSALTPVYSVGDQVAETLLVHNPGMSKQDAGKRAVELLDLVGIPAAARRAKSFPHEFSGGMRQRVVIAMAIANDPKLIIADEPTTALDVTIQAQILDVLRTAKEVTQAALVLITHDLGVVAGNVDRVAVMYAGRLVENGGVEEVFEKPSMPYTIGLLRSVPDIDPTERKRLLPLEGSPPSLLDLPPGCPFAPRCPVALPECTDGEPDLSEVLSGAHRAACIRAGDIASGAVNRETMFGVAPARSERTIGEAEPVLKVTDLKKVFPLTKGVVFARTVGEVRAVDGVSFSIRAGEALGLVGESGSGKTTTILEVLELAGPQHGEIEVLGHNTATLTKKARRALRADVQVVFQDPMASLDPRLPVSDIIGEPLQVQGMSGADRRRRVLELLETVGLAKEHVERYPHEFSGGQRQRIGIARALAVRPKLLVLDEPVSALDVSIQAGVLNLLDDLRSELNLSYLFVAHDLGVVRHIADRVAVMYLGKLVELGEIEDVFARPRHPYSKALLSAVPVPDPKRERERQRIVLTGDMPAPTDEIVGCRFRGRCPLYLTLGEAEQSLCQREDPDLDPAADGRGVACHHTRGVLTG